MINHVLDAYGKNQVLERRSKDKLIISRERDKRELQSWERPGVHLKV